MSVEPSAAPSRSAISATNTTCCIPAENLPKGISGISETITLRKS
jgi:hypothetical protein